MRIKRKTKSKSKNKNKIKVVYQGTCASCNNGNTAKIRKQFIYGQGRKIQPEWEQYLQYYSETNNRICERYYFQKFCPKVTGISKSKKKEKSHCHNSLQKEENANETSHSHIHQITKEARSYYSSHSRFITWCKINSHYLNWSNIKYFWRINLRIMKRISLGWECPELDVIHLFSWWQKQLKLFVER